MSRKVRQSPLELVSAETSACPPCESTMFSDSRTFVCATQEPTVARASSVRFREGQGRNRTLPPARERPDITLFIEFPATYQWAGSGNQLATSKGAWGPFDC